MRSSSTITESYNKVIRLQAGNFCYVVNIGKTISLVNKYNCMTGKLTVIILCLGISTVACKSKTVKIVNEKKGQLKATMKLVNIAEKKFLLDSNTAPRPQYIQLYSDSNGKMDLTFLNTYANSIYFYDYKTATFLKKISYDKKGPNGIPGLIAYYIRNQDSIYLFSRMSNEFVIANNKGKFGANISLINNINIKNPAWTYLYPQYFPFTITPILVSKNELVFPGQYGMSIPEVLIDTLKFTANISLTNNHVTHTHRYPRALYGNNYNWARGYFTTVYSDLSPRDGEIIYSFPVSHDIYIAKIDAEGYRTVYAGSNEAGTISSFNKKSSMRRELPDDELLLKACEMDLYSGIKYDKYRKVYYRFLRRALPDANKKSKITDKPLAVIVFDENFNYLGETTLGKYKNYYCENSFVTEEGLNIEYIDDNDLKEDNLTFKIFSLQKK